MKQMNLLKTRLLVNAKIFNKKIFMIAMNDQKLRNYKGKQALTKNLLWLAGDKHFRQIFTRKNQLRSFQPFRVGINYQC